MTVKTNLVLLNEHLRLFDNPALYEASKTNSPMIVAYIWDHKPSHGRAMGSSQMWWTYHSLRKLDQELRKLGSSLTIQKGMFIPSVEALIKQGKVGSIYCNSFSDPQKRSYLKELKTLAREHSLSMHSFAPNLLVDPTEISTSDGGYCKVFTPFWKRCLQALNPSECFPAPNALHSLYKGEDTLESLEPEINIICKNLEQYWEPGEVSARKRLEEFLEKDLENYHIARDRMDMSATSRISAHLRSGELSVREVWHKVLAKKGAVPEIAINTYLKELGFREFSYYLLHHFPELPSKNFRPEFDRFSWDNQSPLLQAWKEGKTGFPIVDAAMRQLKKSGWIHNRARMIAGSFLTKDLFIDWREGEKWFWECLVDADPALNAFNWQWVAGTGADAAPYFRIFNPDLQAQKFDPEQVYTKTWIPEFDGSSSYKSPVVDHKTQRDEALKRYQNLKQ